MTTVSEINSILSEDNCTTEVCDNERYNVVLKEYFPDGLKQNIIHIKKFIQCYSERFGEEINLSREDVLGKLQEVGTILDERIFAGQDEEQSDLVGKIVQNIINEFEQGASCVYWECILQRYRQELIIQLNIYNEDALQALILSNLTDGYYVRYGYLCKNGIQPDYNMDVVRVMKKNHIPVTYQEIQEQLWYLPMDRIKYVLVMEASLVNVDTETYLYAPNLTISTNELKILVSEMSKEISDKGFLVSKNVRWIIDHKCPLAAIDTASFKDWGVRNCLSYILRENFNFNSSLISKKGDNLTMGKAWKNYCRQYEKLSLEQLKEFSQDVGVQIYWDDVMCEMIRISQTELVRNDKISFDISVVDNVLDSLCTGKYMAIKDVTLFLQFPAIEYPWNGFILESYLRNYSKEFHLRQVSISDNDYFGVMIRNYSEFKSYEDVVVDMLAHSHNWDNAKTALDLIVQKGYQARRRWTGFEKILKLATVLREEVDKKEK